MTCNWRPGIVAIAMLAMPSLPGRAQTLPPSLGAGGINGAVGGGPAAGAPAPIAPPPAPTVGYTPSPVTPNAAVNPGGALTRPTVVTSRRVYRPRRTFRRYR